MVSMLAVAHLTALVCKSPTNWKTTIMAKRCDVCNKGPMTGYGYTFLRSHWNAHAKRRWLPNLQPVKAVVNKSIKRLKVCTSCIKAGKIQRAV
jgi:large subunit ribosomal protein L28